MEKLRDDLYSKDAAKRARAEQALAEVTDPRAVPMIWAIFVPGSERHQIAAVQMLGQIDGPSASNGLAALAIFSPGPDVRKRATETLGRRDPRDVVGRLIGWFTSHSSIKCGRWGPGSPGELFVEGERFNLQRFYENQTGTLRECGPGRLFTPDVPFDPFSVRNLVMAMPPWTTSPSCSHDAGNGYSINRLLSRYRPKVPPKPDRRSRPTLRIPRRSSTNSRQQSRESDHPRRPGPSTPNGHRLNSGSRSWTPGYTSPLPNNMEAFVRQVQVHQNRPE